MGNEFVLPPKAIKVIGVACFIGGTLVGGLFGFVLGLNQGSVAIAQVSATYDKALADVANEYRNANKPVFVPPAPTAE